MTEKNKWEDDDDDDNNNNDDDDDDDNNNNNNNNAILYFYVLHQLLKCQLQTRHKNTFKKLQPQLLQ
jgi:TATA-binding protein-associated factor Taf7